MDKQPAQETPSHEGHRARLRERFLATGLTGFAPHEALELLLTFAIPRRDVKPLAHSLLQRFGSFNRVLEASAKDLTAFPGIGEQAATLLTLVLPLFKRYRQSLAQSNGQPLDQDSLLAVCQGLLLGERVERFFVISLDARGRLISHALISSGDEGETAVYPRLIAAELLRAGAASCVLAHNHPSALAQPSRADVELTRALKDILAPLSITIQDHLIIAGDTSYSFSANGLL